MLVSYKLICNKTNKICSVQRAFRSYFVTKKCYERSFCRSFYFIFYFSEFGPLIILSVWSFWPIILTLFLFLENSSRPIILVCDHFVDHFNFFFISRKRAPADHFKCVIILGFIFIFQNSKERDLKFQFCHTHFQAYSLSVFKVHPPALTARKKHFHEIDLHINQVFWTDHSKRNTNSKRTNNWVQYQTFKWVIPVAV